MTKHFSLVLIGLLIISIALVAAVDNPGAAPDATQGAVTATAASNSLPPFR